MVRLEVGDGGTSGVGEGVTPGVGEGVTPGVGEGIISGVSVIVNSETGASMAKTEE